MGISFLISFAIVSFAVNAAAQLAQTTTTDANKKPIYIAGASTSSVAAPAFTPTLVYNCYYMPLICENVANFAKSVNPNGGGDLAAPQLFYFDPNDAALTSRRRKACGCFDHDGCTTATAQGKTSNGVVAIAGQAPFNTLNTPLSQANRNIILAGTNPSVDKNGVLQPRVAMQSVPGRFYGVNGVAFSCDEFPAATFIEGGIGDGTTGNRAKTICAMSNWKLYTAQTSPGKWPFVSGSGQDREQDWQGKSHNLLRNALNVGSKANKRGWGTVYPFSFTTTTLQAQVQTKAYVVKAAAVTKAVMKRDGTPTTSTYIATTTLNVFGDEISELRHRDYDADAWRQYGTGEERMDLSLPGLRVRQALAPASTSGSSSSSPIGSSQTSNFTTLTSYSSGATVSLSTSNSISAPSSSSAASASTPSSLITVPTSSTSGASTVTPSTLSTVQISSSSGNAASSSAGSFVGASSATVSSASAGISSLSGSSLSASASGTLGSLSATASSASEAGSSLTGTSSSESASAALNPLYATASSASVDVSSLTGTLLSASASATQGSTVGTNSSASGLSVTPSSATGTLGTSLSASGPSNTDSSGTGTITGSSATVSLGTSSNIPAASITQSSGAIVAGNPVATSSASAVSSKVASASSAAALLVANPSNKQYGQTAQKQTHDAKDAAAAMLSLAIGGSPLAGALSSLVGSLGTAAAAADAAVDAGTTAGVSTAAADLVSDLADAAKNAEEVKKDSENDDEPSNSPSASEAEKSKASQASQTTPSSQSNPSTITPSASITALSSGSLSSSASSQSKASSGSITSSASTQSNSSLTTQTSASATPTQCTLTFYVDGDEDPEVSDDYDDLDDDSGDDGVCNPVLGPGGSVVPCGASNSANATSGAVSSTPVSATGALTASKSGSASSISLTSLIASSTGRKVMTSVSSAASSPPKSTSSSAPPKSTPSSTPPAKSSTPPPPPPPAKTSTPPPPPSTPPAPPTPSQTSSNNKGSALCASIGGTTCRIAYSQYNDTYLYTAYTSYILPSGDNSVINDLFAPFADNGCAAMFTCKNAADYAVGMTGEQIKDAFDNLYKDDNVKVCGSSYLSNGCHVTVNGCDNCKPGVPCGSLDAANIANKYPCYT